LHIAQNVVHVTNAEAYILQAQPLVVAVHPALSVGTFDLEWIQTISLDSDFLIARTIRGARQHYACHEHIRIAIVREDVRVGAVLPAQGVTYYEVPAEYKVQGYRYTIVNDTPVLVEPGTRRIVQIVR